MLSRRAEHYIDRIEISWQKNTKGSLYEKLVVYQLRERSLSLYGITPRACFSAMRVAVLWIRSSLFSWEHVIGGTLEEVVSFYDYV